MKHQYDGCGGNNRLLRAYGLEKDFKLNIEANHATLAATFQHELAFAAIHGMLGSIDINQGDAAWLIRTSFPRCL